MRHRDHEICRSVPPNVALSPSRTVWQRVAVAICCLALPAFVAADDEAADTVTLLRGAWAQQRSPLDSVDIEYIEYQGAYQFPPQTREDVLRTLLAIEFTNPDQTVRELACAVCGVAVPEKVPAYPRRRFQSAGAQTRVDDGGAGRGETVFDGVRVIQKAPVGAADGPQQITIGSAPGQLAPALLSVSDFRWVPTEQLAGLPWNVVQDSGDRWGPGLLSLSSGSSDSLRLVADPNTGDVISMQSVTASNHVDREIIQQQFREVSAGCRFPMLSMTATYTPDGSLKSLGIRALLKVDLGTSATAALAPVSASQGDVLMDHASGNGDARVVRNLIADVTAVPAPELHGVAVEKGWELQRWIIALNGALLVIAGAIFLRRRKRGLPKS